MVLEKTAVVAAKEWRDGWRNRWLLAITLTYAVLALGISWFGSAAFGQSGPAPLAATIASLSSLAVLVMPLIALLLGYDAFVGEQEQGTLLLVMTYPIKRGEFVLGKWLGQGAILSTATIVGFGSAVVLIGLTSGSWQHLSIFAVFILAAVVLGLVFLSLAHLLSLLVSEKSQAAGLALFLWLFFAVLYDLGLLALLVGTEGWVDSNALRLLLMLNPTDVFRMINLQQLDASGSGVLASLGELEFSISALFAVLTGWILVSLSLAIARFKTR